MALSADQLKQEVLKFAPQWAWALDNPEIADILRQAVDPDTGGWDAGKLSAAIQDTNWWKGTEPSVREYQQRIKTDPAAHEERRRETEAQLWDLSRKLGLNLSADVIRAQAVHAQQYGLSPEQLTDALVKQTQDAGLQSVQGQAGQIQSTMLGLRKQANSYFVDIDDNTAFQWATQVASGEKNAADFVSIFQDWSKAKFSYDPSMVERINAGFTPEQLFQSHTTAMARLLEVDPASIKLTDPKWHQVLDYADPKSGQRRAMTVTEAQRLTRSTNEWRKTQNGQQAGSALMGNITKMFQGR